jgi:hypothetical protein
MAGTCSCEKVPGFKDSFNRGRATWSQVPTVGVWLMNIVGRIGVLALALGSLSGCYVDPGYSYVRGGGGGGAYVGDPEPEYIAPAPYYGPAYGDYGYYGGGVGVSTIWIDDGRGHRYRRDGPPPRNFDRDHGGRGDWHGRDGDRNHDGDHRPPPGGWEGRPPGNGPRPAGNARPANGGGGNHPHPAAGTRPPGDHGGSHHDDHHDH